MVLRIYKIYDRRSEESTRINIAKKIPLSLNKIYSVFEKTDLIFLFCFEGKKKSIEISPTPTLRNKKKFSLFTPMFFVFFC